MQGKKIIAMSIVSAVLFWANISFAEGPGGRQSLGSMAHSVKDRPPADQQLVDSQEAFFIWNAKRTGGRSLGSLDPAGSGWMVGTNIVFVNITGNNNNVKIKTEADKTVATGMSGPGTISTSMFNKTPGQ